MAQATIQISKIAFDAQQEQMKKLMAKVAALEKGETPTATPDAALLERLAKAEEENRMLKANQAKMNLSTPQRHSLSMKVAENSKQLSVYGLGRFPVTLPKERWGKLLGMKQDILTFIKAHKSELKTKGEK